MSQAQAPDTAEPTEHQPAPKRWSKRHRPSQRLKEAIDQGFLAYVSSATEDYDGKDQYDIQSEMSNPIAFSAKSDPDTMYLDEALKQPDRKKFIQAMVDEVESHTSLGHWQIIARASVPINTMVLPSVWAMKRK